MRTSKKFLKAAICGLLFTSAFAKPQEKFIFQGAQSGISNAWQQFQDVIHDTTNEVNEVVDDISKSLKAFSHPAFPQYAMRYKTPSLCDPSVKQISGYLDVDDDKHFFFWFFESRNKPEEDPLVLWLNGGPGCSSLTGLFMELGPCTVNKAGDDTKINPYSWNSNSSVVFLDQPLNVGYSYGNGGATNTVEAAKHVYAFLQLFFKEFSEYAHLDFHVAGESYAGHYIPRIGTEVNRNNKGQFTSSFLNNFASTLKPINLKSLLIGNGLTDPLIQYKYYAQMACENSYGPVLDKSTCDNMKDQYPACARLIKNCYKSQSVFSCLPAAMKCNKDQIQPYQQTGMNPYDVREKCRGGNLCYEILESVQTYLNRDDVKKAVGAPNIGKYESCNMQINFRFNLAGDWMRPYVNEVPPLLEDGIRILIYSGDADFICNWMGNKAWTLELPWSGRDQFRSAEDNDWMSSSGEKVGELRSTKDGQFAFLRVAKAGHMVPYDQPEASLEMLNQWVRNELQ
ncbi:Alpha/Beta hydrolase protein [Halteromyces radiatus]|uniref:Alpha/Beta hydrolase protein n=1 Tax=Halteromyces radiatus TaxID=101107 RepID=UPI00221EB0D6|nr:Alpha/Beta hydrolase protein [Halteromyces radiatus]KAI8099227.1 Alpha/Beta hydrolase protein [Halteromyces radiatus]